MGHLLVPVTDVSASPPIDNLQAQCVLADGCQVERFRELVRVSFWLTHGQDRVVEAKIVIPMSAYMDVISTMLTVTPHFSGSG
jgi:hypothetical protein